MLHHTFCRGSSGYSIFSGRVPGLEGSMSLHMQVRVCTCSRVASSTACIFSGLCKAAQKGGFPGSAHCISPEDLASQPSLCPLAVSPREEITQEQTQRKGGVHCSVLTTSGLRGQRSHPSCGYLLLDTVSSGLTHPAMAWVVVVDGQKEEKGRRGRDRFKRRNYLRDPAHLHSSRAQAAFWPPSDFGTLA